MELIQTPRLHGWTLLLSVCNLPPTNVTPIISSYDLTFVHKGDCVYITLTYNRLDQFCNLHIRHSDLLIGPPQPPRLLVPTHRRRRQARTHNLSRRKRTIHRKLAPIDRQIQQSDYQYLPCVFAICNVSGGFSTYISLGM